MWKTKSINSDEYWFKKEKKSILYEMNNKLLSNRPFHNLRIKIQKTF